jgi:lipopolysaccharide/colanic/teichoic acid biosynthesis glycosyltransferase
MTASRRPYDRAKRVIDVAVALTLLLLATPIIIIVYMVVLTTLGRPVLFRQARPGQYGRLFRLVKFRTMRTAGEADGPASDDARLTRAGRWLRATSLDELPTLFNVLRGDMSLVGPRPLLPQYLDRYSPEQARRHAVRPGVTGLAQVRGRNGLSWESKFAYDVQYVDRRSLLLDLWILLETVHVVLRREGISAHGTATAPEFAGRTAELAGTLADSNG